MSNLDKFGKRVLITGGAGFIGSNLLHYMIAKYPDYLFVNLDKLTYAGNLSNLQDTEMEENYIFARGDIADRELVGELFQVYQFNGLINLAAETHVDRSLLGADKFINTNIIGTHNLLEISRRHNLFGKEFRFHHVSTDEVFGSLGAEGKFSEKSCYAPNSPYAASKASSDHFVRAYNKSYGLNVVTSNCSNNYGPYQFPEKIIPLMINNALNHEPLPVYGDGENVRDWLYVEDHCKAIDLVFHHGQSGKTYNIGGDKEIKNIDLVRMICKIVDDLTGEDGHEKLIKFVEDRPGHDWRYAMDYSLIKKELGWKPEHDFEQGLRKTVQWYLDNREWMEKCISGEYKTYYNTWYKKRLEEQ
ncbi:MAG: dTDP-glucose 4,6-dehydratase [candidate division Zixibacteria bacterium]|nr:dTDP-glucose 4,6-dehydratase [candidate division Zixibacteria bacterium]NIR64981.1 dTDP-glucose 4,6-dehydratase [candidate division Zixibacteria bacterium]NIS18026.1 dTDP-glucose 4,6-dehydratase [candidate division Zixibacteria bacterium]NIS48806.1 dTDP-glucose 4,6-dehydratase [candidate division Zixibacteria bacterium]NIT54306.1 dTDP-glucose 4,6-dehydratase [candidate division Zixibacteria bacterium]